VKPMVTPSLDLALNLHDIAPSLNTEAANIFSEALYRSKFPESVRSEPAVLASKRKVVGNKQQIAKRADDTEQQEHSENVSFLTPSMSVVSLHGKNTRCKKRPKHVTARKLKSEMHQISRHYRQNRVNSSKPPAGKVAAIPIKCFNDRVLETRIQSHVQQRRKRNTRAKSVSTGDDGRESDEFSIGDIERYHEEMVRNKESMQPSMVVYNEENNNESNKIGDLSLEHRLQRIIARWESNEKIKSRCASRRKPRAFRM